jgi:hypothetical protein
LFIRSSARLGLWVGVVGAAVNYYYYHAFVGVVFSEKKLKTKPWRLYKWTKRRTVDDGCLAGAAVGLAASIPTLFMRRPAIPRWTRCLGMTNIGACAGILGAHGYLHYTGERQRAYKRLDRRLKRRSLEFWAIFWDKPLMAKFNPLIQQYIRHNGIWYTSNLPDTVFEQPEEYGRRVRRNTASTSETDAAPSASAEPWEDELPYYTQPFDYADDLAKINVESTRAKMDELEAEKKALLREGEYILWVSAQKEYHYCHAKDMDDDERLRRLREIMLCQISYNRTQTAACAIDNKLAQWRMSLQHKAVTEAHPDGDDALESWLPSSAKGGYAAHDPTLAMQEIEQFQTQIAAEVRRFEELVADQGYPREKRDRWRRDLEDGRTLLRAADMILWEFETVRMGLESKRMMMEKEKEVEVEVGKVSSGGSESSEGGVGATKTMTSANDKEIGSEEEKSDQRHTGNENDGKRSTGGLEPDKP